MGEIAGVPFQPGQSRGKVHRMLTAATADFEDASGVVKYAMQPPRNVILVAFAGR